MKTGRLSYGAMIGLGLTLGFGCGGEQAQQAEPQTQTRTQTITAQDVRILAAGEMLTVDTRDTQTTHIFDQSEGFIELERVNLICPDGKTVKLSEWIEAPTYALKQPIQLQSSFLIGHHTPVYNGCQSGCVDEDGYLTVCGYNCVKALQFAWYMDDRLQTGEGWPRQGPTGPTPPTPPDDEGGGDPGPGTGDPNDGGRPSDGGSGSTGGSGSSGSGGSTGNPPGGHGSAGGHGGTGGTGGGGGGLF